MNQLFGQTDSTVGRGNAESGYILFYQQVDKSELDLFNFDLASLETRYVFPCFSNYKHSTTVVTVAAAVQRAKRRKRTLTKTKILF